MQEDSISTENILDDDVLLFEDRHTYKGSVFKKGLSNHDLKNGIGSQLVGQMQRFGFNGLEIQIDKSSRNDQWFHNGKVCKMLRPGSQGWQTGKLRLKLTLEFCPDEPEEIEKLENSESSPLDDLRQKLNLETEKT